MGRRARSCVEVMLITEHIRGFEPRIERRRRMRSGSVETLDGEYDEEYT